jgi:hypothetical protein
MLHGEPVPKGDRKRANRHMQHEHPCQTPSWTSSSREDRQRNCPGRPENCQLLADSRRARRHWTADAEIQGTTATVDAMAVGLVLKVWRNSPVENMHASPAGPGDAVMFAESTALHGKAVEALRAGNRVSGLLDFEEYLLDRRRPWAGADGKTLRDFGYGHLGKYARHVKDQTGILLSLNRHTCVGDPLEPFLIVTALAGGKDHKGMPMWPVIVQRISILLADPAHPEWGDSSRGSQALADKPPETPPTPELTAALLTTPSTLPTVVLEWLSLHLLHCAGPPYGLKWG